MPANTKLPLLLKQYALSDQLYAKDVKTGKISRVPERARLLMEAVCRIFPNVPHYLVDADLINTVVASDPTPQLNALRQFEAARLPFREMVVELPINSTGDTYFFYIGDDPDGTVEFLVGGLDKYNHAIEPVHAMSDPYDPNKPEQLIRFHHLDRPNESQQWSDEMFTLYSAMVLMPHIKGVEREEHPAPSWTNKKREKKGKPPLKGFTRLYIGRVEDKDGKSHEYTGRTMPVHMRAGHTRRQHHGPGNSLIKTVYIQPVLVNFNPGDEVPVPRRIVKMAS